MTLTVSPESVIIVIIGLLLVLIAAVIYLGRKISESLYQIFTEVIDARKIIRADIDLHDSHMTAAGNASYDRDTAILNGDKAILAVAQANNEALKLLCGKGGVMDAGKLGRTREALRVAQAYALEKGLNPEDVGIPDLLREMGEDTP